METTLIGLFGETEATKVVQALRGSGIPLSKITVIDEEVEVEGGEKKTESFWEKLKEMFGIGEEHHYFAEGVRRGSTLVSVEVPPSQADAVREILERHNPVDLDVQADEWRRSGWDIPRQAAPGARAVGLGPSGMGSTGEGPTGMGSTAMGAGGIGSPSPRKTGSDPAIGQQSIGDMMATEHQPPARSQARGRMGGVRAYQRGPAPSSPSLGASEVDHSAFQDAYDRHFAGLGLSYDECAPAFRFGRNLRASGGMEDWSSVEPDAKKRWESQYPGTWEKLKDVVRHAWDKMRSELGGKPSSGQGSR